MSDRKRAPKGWKVRLSVTLLGVPRWEVERDEGGATWAGHSSTLDVAYEAAVAYAWALEREANPPKPADPAWMVEVAREIQRRLDDDDAYPAAIIAFRLAIERGHVVEGGPIREMLLAGQGDDDGSQILPDLHEGMTLHEMVAACVNLLERRRDALDGYADSGRKPRPAPSEEELLKAAREDAAQALEAAGYARPLIDRVRRGGSDGDIWVTSALQARRNMLREMGSNFSVQPAREDWATDPDFREVGDAALDASRPGVIFYREGSAQRVDLEAALKRAWDAASVYFMTYGLNRRQRQDDEARDDAVSSILSTLPAKEGLVAGSMPRERNDTRADRQRVYDEGQRLYANIAASGADLPLD